MSSAVFCVSFGVAFAVSFGIASVVAFGVSFGVAFGMAFVLVLGVVSEVKLLVAWGVALGVTLGVTLGVASGVASGATFGVACILGFLRAYFWIPELLWMFLLLRFVPEGDEAKWLWCLPPYFDQLIHLPMPLMDYFIVKANRQNPSCSPTNHQLSN